MENEITTKRGLILILVIASVAVFIGLVWLIATYLPLNFLGASSPSITPNTPKVLKNCTYPISYWMDHSELYPPQILFGSKVYQANEIRGVLTRGDQDPAAKLQAQLVVAFLNFSSGADQTIIETTIFQAYSWLVQHPEGSEASSSDIETGLRYFSLLDAYNLGSAGVAACEGVFTTGSNGTLIPTETATLLFTMTPSQTATSTPSEVTSPTPSETTVTATYLYILPTNTVIWITQTPIRLPSNTPIKPTEQPPPTNTPRPPNTPTFTPPPPATPTFTLPPPATPTFTLPPLPTATYTLPPSP